MQFVLLVKLVRRCSRYCWHGGTALGKLVDALDGDDTVCVEVRAALGKLVSALVGAALVKLVSALDGDETVCVEVGAALDKLVNAIDGDTVCLHHDMYRKT